MLCEGSFRVHNLISGRSGHCRWCDRRVPMITVRRRRLGEDGGEYQGELIPHMPHMENREGE